MDIVEIDRMQQSVDSGGNAFRDRVFTEREIAYCESKKQMKYQSYAVRFAAKEAVSKAFGTGIGEKVGWKDIEVTNDASGKPSVVLYGKARELFEAMGGKSLAVSLSHCKSYAVAHVVLEV